ncbi:MAG: stage II sporulation protein P, partial [Bacillota bacterium]
DESYIKGDGADSKKGNGGILDVAAAFADALRQKGFNVVHSTAKHDPHDEGAYNRSRRTATSLLKQQPLAIFDVHRDAAVPPEQYVSKVDNQQVTKVRLVVGRQNPKRSVNDAFAKQLKAVGDKVQPGLIKGIFYARGNYNQDLSNKAMLLELGTEKNAKDDAEKGIAAFSNVVAATFSGTTTPAAPGGSTGTPSGGGTTRNTSSPGAGRALATIVGLVVLGGIGFLAISTGGFKEMGGKLKQLGTSEFASFLGRFRKKRGDD